MLKKQRNWGWFFVSPYVLGLLLFTFIPMVFSAYISFTDYNLYNESVFVGLKNYASALTDVVTWESFRNIFVYAVVMNSVQIFFGAVLANLLIKNMKGTSFFRVMYFIPALTPVVASCFVWESLYNPMFGIFNQLLELIGIGPFNYCYSSNWFEAVASIGVMQGWKGIGYTTVYFLAGMQGISKDVLEAADIDGAGGVKKFFRITLPMISPTIFFLIMTGMITSLQVFEPFYLMQNDTGASTSVIGMLIYENAFMYGKAGYAAAISWISFAVIMMITYAQKSMEKRWVFYE